MKKLKQIDGKINGPKTLDQVWGDDGTSKYQTMDEEEYKERINEMNNSEMQNHAYSVGLLPHDNREILASRLIREFRNHVSQYQVTNYNLPKYKAPSKAVRDILAEGR